MRLMAKVRPNYGSDPLRVPHTYDAHCQVEVCIQEPCSVKYLDENEVSQRILALCFNLDLLIRTELQQQQSSLETSPIESDAFQAEAADVLEKITRTLQHLPPPVPELEDYLDSRGLSLFFPRVEVYIIHGRPVDMLEQPPLDDYFENVCRLNQILVLSQQLQGDVYQLNRHKYIAHRIAVLYRAMHQMGDVALLAAYRRDVEARFPRIKACLSVEEPGKGPPPTLPDHHAKWLLQLTSGLVKSLLSLPYELSEGLSPAMAMLSHAS
uniref:Uncharacterized protein LOC116952203 isoform X2 n=1 Tax=Petromyzon marinus TaxID=7757 RepID=A0AAJ7U223_PETMA|nr:uncharacterized protein LOC116952203 isoform X2 [Petromyzon marinus]